MPENTRLTATLLRVFFEERNKNLAPGSAQRSLAWRRLKQTVMDCSASNHDIRLTAPNGA